MFYALISYVMWCCRQVKTQQVSTHWSISEFSQEKRFQFQLLFATVLEKSQIAPANSLFSYRLGNEPVVPGNAGDSDLRSRGLTRPLRQEQSGVWSFYSYQGPQVVSQKSRKRRRYSHSCLLGRRVQEPVIKISHLGHCLAQKQLL